MADWRAVLSWDGESWTSHPFPNWASIIRPWPSGIVWFMEASGDFVSPSAGDATAIRWEGSTLVEVEASDRPDWWSPFATAPDGSAWTVIEEQLYVITPEAVAGTG